MYGRCLAKNLRQIDHRVTAHGERESRLPGRRRVFDPGKQESCGIQYRRERSEPGFIGVL